MSNVIFNRKHYDFPIPQEVETAISNLENAVLTNVNQDCTDALLRIYPRVDMDKINEVIFTNPYISDIRKEFYSVMIQKRWNGF